MASILVLFVANAQVPSTSQQKEWLPVGTVDFFGVTPIASDIGATKAHREAVRLLRGGQVGAATERVKRLIERKPDDLLAWKILFDSARGNERAWSESLVLLQRTQQKIPIGDPRRQRIRLLSNLALDIRCRPRDPMRQTMENRMRALGLEFWSRYAHRLQSPEDVAEAHFIASIVWNAGSLETIREPLVRWYKRFREPSLGMMAALALSRTTRGDEVDGDFEADLPRAQQILLGILRQHPDIALPNFFAGSIAFTMGDPKAAGFLRRYLQLGDREPARIERARSLLRQLEKGG